MRRTSAPPKVAESARRRSTGSCSSAAAGTAIAFFRVINTSRRPSFRYLQFGPGWQRAARLGRISKRHGKLAGGSNDRPGGAGHPTVVDPRLWRRDADRGGNAAGPIENGPSNHDAADNDLATTHGKAFVSTPCHIFHQ